MRHGDPTTFGLSVGGLLATLLDTGARQDYTVDLLRQEVHDLRNLIAEEQGRIDTLSLAIGTHGEEIADLKNKVEED